MSLLRLPNPVCRSVHPLPWQELFQYFVSDFLRLATCLLIRECIIRHADQVENPRVVVWHPLLRWLGFSLLILLGVVPLFISLLKTRIVGREKVSQRQTKLFKLISTNCFLFQLYWSWWRLWNSHPDQRADKSLSRSAKSQPNTPFCNLSKPRK